MSGHYSEIYYYRIVKHAQSLAGSEVPLNVLQLQEVVGTETSLEDFEDGLLEKYLTYVRLGDVVGCDVPAKHINEEMRKRYPWVALAQSIKEIGIRVPVILERTYIKGKNYYIALEGKHRLTAATTIKPFNPDMLVPSVAVDRDNVFTDIMYKREHPKTVKKSHEFLQKE